MALHECTGAGCVAKPEAIAELLDGPPISAGLASELEKSRLLAARMLDQLRFQHEVLAEIHDLASSASAEKSRLLAARMLDQLRFQHEVLAEIHDLASSASAGDSHYRLNLISIKAGVAARAAANSGLLS